MATIIKIKRSSGVQAPSELAQGELAFTYGTGSQGNFGDRLFIGSGTETNGVAANIDIIGGKYFTQLLDHVHGTLSASSALLVDSNKAIDEIFVGNNASTGGGIKFNEGTNNGAHYVQLKAPNSLADNVNFTLPISDGSSGQFLQTDGSGNLSFGTVTQTLSIAADVGSNDTVNTGETITFTGDTGITTTVSNNDISIDLDDTAVTPGSYGSTTAIPTFTVDQQGRITAASTVNVATTLNVSDDSSTGLGINLLTDTLNFAGGEGIDTTISGDTVIVSAEDASTSNKGVASFDSNDFDVTSGAVTLEDTVVKTVTTDSGALTPSTHGFTINGGEGMDVTHVGTTITVAGEDASTSNKGVASFDSNDFDVASGAVTLEDTVVKTVTTDSGAMTPTSHSFSVLGGEGMNVTHAGTTITVEGEDATSSNKGVASFDSTDFTVTSGAVVVNTITLGSSSLNPGETTTAIAGITELTVDNLNFNGNTISTTNANGDLVLDPNGTGDVDVNNSKIVNVATPTASTDAANKAYVDGVVNGLDVKESVVAATTANLSATYDNGAGTLTASSNGALSIDGVTPSQGDRILVKDQSNAIQNGIYTVTTVGDGSTQFVLTRSPDADTAAELTGGTFFFVESGSNNADNGYVATHNGTPTFGTTNITFSQFSGAGQISAGDALIKTGNQLDVVVDDSTIAVVSDRLEIKSTYSGQGSITTLGTISSGTWEANTIEVSYGGTGRTTFTSNGIVYGNGTSQLNVTASGTDGYFLYSNAGTPDWTNTLDGGTFS